MQNLKYINDKAIMYKNLHLTHTHTRDFTFTNFDFSIIPILASNCYNSILICVTIHLNQRFLPTRVMVTYLLNDNLYEEFERGKRNLFTNRSNIVNAINTIFLARFFLPLLSGTQQDVSADKCRNNKFDFSSHAKLRE